MADIGAASFWPRPIRSLFRPLSTAAAGMSTQQAFMETIAANIANAETTRTAEGGPYRRQVAVADGSGRVTVMQDGSDGRMVYDPGHPDANASGYVKMPNVDISTEMVDMMLAQRMHQANVTVFQAAKAMLRRAIDI